MSGKFIYRLAKTMFYSVMSLFIVFMTAKGFYVDSGVDEFERSRRSFIVDDLEALMFLITAPLVFLYYFKKAIWFRKRRKKSGWKSLLIHTVILGFFLYYFIKSLIVFSPG